MHGKKKYKISVFLPLSGNAMKPNVVHDYSNDYDKQFVKLLLLYSTELLSDSLTDRTLD